MTNFIIAIPPSAPAAPSPMSFLPQADCNSDYSLTQCDAVSLSGTVTYPIDWTVGDGAVMDTDWCPMTLNTAADECPSSRQAESKAELFLVEHNNTKAYTVTSRNVCLQMKQQAYMTVKASYILRLWAEI